jgi:hypothetical protein
MSTKQPTTRNVEQLEIYDHHYKGIAVRVKIDYPNAEVSLLDGKNEPKDWRFARRTPEYLNPWLNILDAMKSAIKEAKEKVEAYEREREKHGLAGQLEDIVIYKPKK